MTSKTFVHVHTACVVENALIEAVDQRRRDIDAQTAFAYYLKRERNYISVEASDSALDATFNREHTIKASDDSEITIKSFTRLQVFDPRTCCERCAAKRGEKHEIYCDSEQRDATTATATKAKSALTILADLKLAAKATTAIVRESDDSATASDDDDDSDSDDDDDVSESDSDDSSDDATASDAKAATATTTRQRRRRK